MILGVVGGGQLGRMTAQAAQRLGHEVCVWATSADEPAARVTASAVIAPYDDPVALERFAGRIDVATFEFENLPVETLERLAAVRSVRPGPTVLATCQDRAAERRFVEACGAPLSPWRVVADEADLAAARAFAYPAVLKTARLGYDGKGQRKVERAEDLAAAWAGLGRVPCVLEAFVGFAFECSVIVARGLDGATALYPPVENRHRDHILHRTIVPAPLDAAATERARGIARTLAERLDLVGLLAVEMFALPDGGLMVNELAPRPHNSGHWTLDAALCDQFAMLVRAVTGAPLGDPRRLCDAVMENLLGDEAAGAERVLADPLTRLHLYGKAEARPGRKMGHVTRLRPFPGAEPR